MQPALPRRFRVLRALGSGIQGGVWLAADRFHGGTLVAVKTIDDANGAWDRDALAREFSMLARLSHPNIAKVRDFGRLAGGGSYFTSEVVEGPNLLEWAGTFSDREKWPALAQAAAQALSALRYLSLKGVRHGDVKPANMLVARTESGAKTPYRLQLIDFGAARLSLASRREAPRIGTPAYLPAPDLIERETSGKTQPGKGHVHPDLYGLGMSLYHAAMG